MTCEGLRFANAKSGLNPSHTLMNTQSATELLEQDQLQVHQQIAQAESEDAASPAPSDDEVLKQERWAAELEQSETDPSAQD